MSVALVSGLVFGLFFILLTLGTPIFGCLGISGAMGILLVRGWVGAGQVVLTMWSKMESFTLVACPLFILMGEVVSRTGIGSDLYSVLSKWLRGLPGGLAIASIFACAIFGAMCGVSIAGVATIGVIAIPEMLKRGYDTKLAVGSVTAAGALAMLIPPSLLFIIYGELAQTSVAKLFIGGIIPGLVLAIMMSLYVMMRVVKNPSLAPKEEGAGWKEKFVSLRRTWPSILLITGVLGTIYTGVATPTESAAMGSAIAFVIAAVVYRAINLRKVWEILKETMRVTGAIMAIIACAMVFARFLSLVNIPESISLWVASMDVSRYAVIMLMMLFLLILGMFIDGGSMVVITTPILLPTVLALGFDPIWYGIILMINIEMAVITPPVGLNLYTLKGVLPEIDLKDILKGTLPYVGIELLGLLIFVFLPGLTLWLPNTMR